MTARPLHLLLTCRYASRSTIWLVLLMLWNACCSAAGLAGSLQANHQALPWTEDDGILLVAIRALSSAAPAGD